MDGWWTPLILAVALLAGGWIWTLVYRPILQIRRLVNDLAEGREPTGFVARGAWGLGGIIVDLDRVAERLRGISSKAQREKFNLRTILGSLTEGVVITDPEGMIRLANRSFLEMFHLSDFPLGQTLMESIRLPEVARAVDETLAERGGRSLEIRRVSTDRPEVKIFSVNFAPILEGSGEISGVVTVFYDLSKVRRLENVRTEFITNLSHELRTPLSILAGYLETLEEPSVFKATEGKKILGVLRRNCGRLTLLVNDLLELSRLESGQLTLQLQPRTPQEILEELEEDWRRSFALKKVRLRIEVEKNLPMVLSDPLRTGQIFANLLENALRFAPAGSVVTLSAGQTEDPRVVEFFVQDEGEGIPKEKLDRIFERFFRVDSDRAREKGGTGLGLSIVKHLVQLHGGSVKAISEVGAGTKVVVHLPKLPHK
ncbi:MAG: PAS domain-containing protein [Verrucomicrobia bacterium]|nr:PAS domain-containing protein [Verrucomicrobiota bacterium]